MSERLMGWVSNMQEPKRQTRFELLLEDTLRLTCNQVSFPSFNIDPVEIHRMHNKYKVAGAKISYGDVTLKFFDYVDNQAASALQEWHRQIYDISTSLMGYPKDYKRDLTLLMYGPDDSVVESWLLRGAWPKDITRPQGLDWSQGGGIIEVSLVLSIDEAKIVLS